MPQPATLGFIGLGQMGKHMARNLMGPGVRLTVSSRSGKEFPSFTEAGAAATTDVKDLAHCDVIFLCLPGDAQVRSVLLAEEGLLPLLAPGTIVVDCSTITYALTTEIAAALSHKGVPFIDAPVSGMEARAREGTLTIMAGGDTAAFTTVLPFLEKMGSKILHMGPSGAGQLAKLVNQLLFDINMAGLAEVLPLAAKMGLDPEKTGEIINSGTGRSYASEFFLPHILEGDFSKGYSLNNAYKDLVSAALLTAREAIPMPVLQAAAATYQTALKKGLGNENKGAMIKIYEELLGVKYRKKDG